MFSRPKILFLVSLLFVALLNSIPTYVFFIAIAITTAFYNFDMGMLIYMIMSKILGKKV